MESYVKTAVNQEQEDDGTNHCCICLENYKTNDVMAVLPCEWVMQVAQHADYNMMGLMPQVVYIYIHTYTHTQADYTLNLLSYQSYADSSYSN